MPTHSTPADAGYRSAPAGRLTMRIALLAVLYIISGRLGLSLAHIQENATLVWPPTGLSLAALILFGQRMWPGVFIGALVVNLSMGSSLGIGLGIAVGNTLEAVVGALLLDRLTGFDPRLARIRDVVAFFLIGVLGCTLASATVGVTTLVGAGAVAPEAAADVWLVWWLGDAGGAMVVAPFLLVAWAGVPPWRELLRRPETWGVFLAVATTTTVAWSGRLPPEWAFAVSSLPFPFMVWAGTRLGPRGAVTTLLIASMAAVAGTATGHHLFTVDEIHSQMLLLWAYVFNLATVALLLAGAVAEREAAVQQGISEREQRLAEALARNQLEHKLHESERLRSLGLLAGGVAHDFNNILVPIRGNAELLGLSHELDPEEREMAKDIELAAVRASELCQRLLAYAGQAPSTSVAVDLGQLLEELRKLLRSTISKKVRLKVDAPYSLPAVHGDPSLLRQVFMNLVLNGAEAIGDALGTVLVRATPTQDAVVVEVVDDGPGMDTETRERIFDPFFTTKFAGRGLGLAAVRGIVDTHGGEISVHSAPGEGTRFVLRLPVSAASEPEPVPPHLAPPPRPEPVRDVARVLVVDDEQAVRDLVVAVLEDDGFAIEVAEHGRQAVEVVRRLGDQLTAVVMDMTMPEMGGAEAIEHIRALQPALPVLLMSGYSEDSVSALAPDGFLSKPFAVADLRQALGQLLPASDRAAQAQ